ncbi:diphosphomevalonate decarboxylase isoform X2 [Strongylocentrotus purpuratus]|uniref:Diphosphomevalonate decarboxylase n=1 Tax=Strongylocentrotus purpuratus TaxID=7668 RepID=A0A7M7N6L3_STRPU|nr:diphosphomevalonate decarboxylase isoform X2 [Strongylocentrotus purpuratus]
MDISKTVTCKAPINIAVIKYWGKRDEKLILPVNSSLSATLHIDQLCTTTSIAGSKHFPEDRLWLNGKEESLENPRVKTCLQEIRKRARKRKISDDESNPEDWKLHICSENNFPTAAGLASSAAGYACLVATLAQVYGVQGNVSDIARQGSGSACRSMYGGFVEWLDGESSCGSDSIAQQVVDENYWSEMRILILVVSDQKKHTSSTAGMQTTVKTSELLQHRVTLIPGYMETMRKAIKDRDYRTFAELTMKDSNQMHAVCLDTYPPISYMNDTSRSIVQMVHDYNSFHGETKACYTFDAGPNAVLYVLEENVSEVLSLIHHSFPPSQDNKEYIRGLDSRIHDIPQGLQCAMKRDPNPGALKYIIHSKVGPQVVTDLELSLPDQNGMPKKFATWS